MQQLNPDDSSGGKMEGRDGNPHWADAMATILHGSQNKHMLTKAKKETDVRYNEPTDTFETVTEEGRKELKTKLIPTTAKRKQIHDVDCRVKPNIIARDKERALARIAAKGVVQLFNAVKLQQKIYKDTLKAAGGSERKQKVLMNTVTKNAFLDLLKKKSSSIPLEDSLKLEETEFSNKTENSTWKILQDDFLLGAKMKDWDRESSEEEVMNLEET